MLGRLLELSEGRLLTARSSWREDTSPVLYFAMLGVHVGDTWVQLLMKQAAKLASLRHQGWHHAQHTFCAFFAPFCLSRVGQHSRWLKMRKMCAPSESERPEP